MCTHNQARFPGSSQLSSPGHDFPAIQIIDRDQSAPYTRADQLGISGESSYANSGRFLFGRPCGRKVENENKATDQGQFQKSHPNDYKVFLANRQSDKSENSFNLKHKVCPGGGTFEWTLDPADPGRAGLLASSQGGVVQPRPTTFFAIRTGTFKVKVKYTDPTGAMCEDKVKVIVR